MKTIPIRNIKKIFLILLILGSMSSQGQLVDGYGILDHWYLSTSAGISSFVGDLSQYDLDPFNKINHESSLSTSFNLGKKISPLLGVRGQFLCGKLKGEKNITRFKTNFSEYAAIMTVDLNKLFFKSYYQPRYNFSAYGGLGMIYYRSIQRNINTDKYISSEGFDENIEPVKPSSGEMLILGGTMTADLNERFELFLDGSFHICNSDKLDAQAGGSLKNDMFSNLSIGIKYKIIELYPLWRPIVTKKYKSSRRIWSRNQSIFTHRKRGVRTLGNTFAVLRHY